MARRQLICYSLCCSVVLLALCCHLNLPTAFASVGRYDSSTSTAAEPSHRHRTSNISDLNGLSTRDMGWMGPLSVSGEYDTELGYITSAKASLGLGSYFAVAEEIQGGSRIFRTNSTLGVAFSPRNRAKLTYEYLREKLDFDFYSGTLRHWDGQSAVGGEYEYLLGKGFVDSLSLGGYYVHSESQNLSDLNYECVGATTCVNRRHIAGANAGDINGTVKYHFWPKSQLKTGLRWDVVRYRETYDIGDANAQGLGVTLGADQLITDRLKLSVDSTLNKIDSSVGGELGVLLPSPRSTRLELAYITNYAHGRTTHRDFYSNGLRAAFSWGYRGRSKPSYSADFGEPNTTTQNLRQWTTAPAVRMSEVLAVVDQAVVTPSGQPIHGSGRHPRDIDWAPEAKATFTDRRRSARQSDALKPEDLNWSAPDPQGIGHWEQIGDISLTGFGMIHFGSLDPKRLHLDFDRLKLNAPDTNDVRAFYTIKSGEFGDMPLGTVALRNRALVKDAVIGPAIPSPFKARDVSNAIEESSAWDANSPDASCAIGNNLVPEQDCVFRIREDQVGR